MDRPTDTINDHYSIRKIVLRWIGLTVMLACLSSAFTGCANRLKFIRQDRTPVDPVLKFGMTDEQIFTHINKTARHLYAWRSSSCDITAYGLLPVPVSAEAILACESPRKFRFLASTIRGPEMDLGSNDNEFWFWANDGGEKLVYMASHEQLDEAQRKLRIPFNPDWVMEVMGVIPIDHTKYHVKWTDDLKEISLATSNHDSTGRAVYRRIVVDSLTGNITRHEMYGAKKQPIALARLSDYRPVGDGHVQLAHQLILEWPQEATKFKMRFKEIDVNPSEQQSPISQWQMPRNSRHRVVNIGLK